MPAKSNLETHGERRKQHEPVVTPVSPLLSAAISAEICFGIGVGISIVLTSLLSPTVPFFGFIVAGPVVLGLVGGFIGGYLHGMLEKHQQKKSPSSISPSLSVVGVTELDISRSLNITVTRGNVPVQSISLLESTVTKSDQSQLPAEVSSEPKPASRKP